MKHSNVKRNQILAAFATVAFLLCFFSCLFSLAPSAEGTVFYGDADSNGVIEAKDYFMIKRYVLGTYTFTAEQLDRCDVNFDGTVNAKDYLITKRAVLGTYTLTTPEERLYNGIVSVDEGSTLRVRSQASLSASKIATLQNQFPVTIHGGIITADSEATYKQWYHITFSLDGKNYDGYVAADFISITGSVEIDDSSFDPPLSESSINTSDFSNSDSSSSTGSPETSDSGNSEANEDSSPTDSSESNDSSEPQETSEPEVIYTINILVTNTAGTPIPNASVTYNGTTYVTDRLGKASISSKTSSGELLIRVTGYVSYYDELDLNESIGSVSIALQTFTSTRDLIDSAELHPYLTNEEGLNDYLTVLLSDLLTTEMDTYDMVKACYDYLIANTYYAYPSHWKRPYQSYYWSCGYQCLVEGFGTCNCYSAAFTAMMKRIGLDCYIVEGYTTKNGGGKTSHEWCMILIHGHYYFFDPQVEDAIAERTSTKEVTYVRFCLEEPSEKFFNTIAERNAEIEDFANYIDQNGSYVEDWGINPRDPNAEPEVSDDSENSDDSESSEVSDDSEDSTYEVDESDLSEPTDDVSAVESSEEVNSFEMPDSSDTLTESINEKSSGV